MRLSLLLLLLATPALAHDLWLDRQDGRYLLRYGHAHSSHAGAGQLDYRPEIVQAALCYGSDGERRQARSEPGHPYALAGDCAVAWFRVSSGYWSKTPYGTKNLARNETTQVLDSWLSRESVKRLDAWGPALARPLGAELEIVPDADPSRLQPGEKLRLTVYAGGRPAAGVTVAYFDQPRGITGNDGRLNLRIRQGGLQLIQASRESPLQDGKADRLVETATLQFQVTP